MPTLLEKVNRYFQSNVYKPFYLAVGDEEYRFIKNKLMESGDIEFIRLSRFCRSADKKPDLDKLRETLRMIDIDCNSNKVVLLGLGEFLALEGINKSLEILNELISFNLGSAHAVFLLRGVSTQVKSMVNDDPRLSDRQVEIGSNTMSALTFTFSSVELKMYDNNGFQKALEAVEDGQEINIRANTALEFPNSYFPVQKVENSYAAICKNIHGFGIPKEAGTEADWKNLLDELRIRYDINYVFEKHGFITAEVDFYRKISDVGYNSWLYFLFLLINHGKIGNPYLRYCVSKSNNFTEFKNNILNAISDFSHGDKEFKELYASRKSLIKDYPEPDIAVFISNNRLNPDESVYKLTDNTLVERQEVIADISQHGLPDNLDEIYPALDLYLKKYHFHNDAINDLLTEYFDAYKRQKVMNRLEDDFVIKVDELANTRVYNRLRTRDEIVASIDKTSTFLCWIDALGVEYLSYIVSLAQKRGLAISVNIGRANLPTITSQNKVFYEVWPDEQKRKIDDLDDTKHKEKGGYKYSPSNKYAIHLAKELKIIEDAINEAATELGLRNYDKYVIASDHGASRLAVIRNKEEKYETDTQGEHSGRCCKVFDGYDLPYATEENGYIVLADYGRFKKSRAANVEVHGGATLEEVVVPVITLSLKDTSIIIKVVDKTLKADYKTGTILNLYVNKSISQAIYVEYKGKKHSAVATDSNHYKVTIEEIKRACTADFDIYLGEDLISHVSLQVVGKSASMNSDFDDLF